jgi:hypothetical protein
VCSSRGVLPRRGAGPGRAPSSPRERRFALRLIALPFRVGDLALDFGFLSLALGSFAVEAGAVAVEPLLRAIQRLLRLLKCVVATSQQVSRAIAGPAVEALVTFVSHPLPHIGGLLPFIGDPLALVSQPLALIGLLLALIGQTVPFGGLTRSLLKILPRLVDAHRVI